MIRKEELELSRNNVTPAQFCAYVRRMIKAHNLENISAGDIDREYWAAGGDLEFSYHDEPGKPCRAEKSVSKPYEMQTYVSNWDGTVYNLIMEFNFWDEKTGSGYFYFVATWDDAEGAEGVASDLVAEGAAAAADVPENIRAKDSADWEETRRIAIATREKVEAGKKVSRDAVGKMLEVFPEMLYQPMPAVVRSMFPVVSVDIASTYFHIHFSKQDGKMTGITSLSTTCKFNRECRRRIAAAFRLVYPSFSWDTADADTIKMCRALLKEYIKSHPLCQDVSICGFCFSDSLQDVRGSMVPALALNFRILNGGIIHFDWLPIVNALWARGESFGDFGSVNAVANFCNLARKNPGVRFGIWTKNPRFFHAYFGGDASRVPDNCNFVLSSCFINRVAAVPAEYAYFIHRVFTVYTPEFAAAHGVVINCGARACLTCLRCYRADSSVFHISEALKLGGHA